MNFLEETLNQTLSNAQEETSSSSSDEEPGPIVILALFSVLCVGALVKQFCIWSKFPYSPCLICVGLAFGLISDKFGALGDSWDYISGIHPHFILVSLLPPIVFDSAFSMSYHIFRKEFWQIILLAGPGILINAILTAICVRFDEFPFDYSCLFGAILAATDPVAVVALLKELGASKTLSHLIEGESLLNDGTALVLFTILKEIVEGKSVTAGHIIWFFCRLSFGGPLLGILFAIASSFWIGKLFKNDLLEMVIIFVAPYLCFYTAECSGLEVSGVLSLCGLGLYMANAGKTAISTESLHSIHILWQFAGYAAETIIFTLAGIIIGVKIQDLDLTLKDWLIVPAFYVALHIIRIIMVVICYPFLKPGYGMNFKKSIVLSYAGLRGAVGLAMALSVYIEVDFKKEARDRVLFVIKQQMHFKILFFTACIACLTIWINGSTTGWLINKLGLSRKNYDQLVVYNQLVEHLIESTEGVIEKTLKHNRFLNVVNWDKVKSLAITPNYIKNIMQFHLSPEGKQVKTFEIDRDNDKILFRNLLTKEQEKNQHLPLVESARNRYLTILKVFSHLNYSQNQGLYWEQFELGELTGPNAILLIEQTENTLDHSDQEIRDWDYLEKQFLRTILLDFVFLLSKIKILSCFSKVLFFRVYILKHVIKSYQISTNYIIANEQSEEFLKEFNFPSHIFQQIKSEVAINIEAASKYLNDYLLLNFKSLIMEIQNHQGAMAVLNYQLNFIEHSFHTGCLNDAEYQKFKNTIQARMIEMQQIQQMEAKEGQIEVSEVISNVPFFKLFFTDDERKQIITASLGNTQMYQKGETLYKEGDVITHLYLVCEGSVREYNSENNRIFYFGYIIGMMYLLGSPKSFILKLACTAETIAQIIKIPMISFQQFLSTMQIFQLWKDTFYDFIKFYPKRFRKLHKKPQNKILEIFNETTYIELDKNDIISINNGCFFLSGMVRIGEKQIMLQPQENKSSSDDSSTKWNSKHKFNGKIIHAPGYLITDQSVTCLSACKFLVFNEQARRLNLKLLSKKQKSKEELMKLTRLQSHKKSSEKYYSKKSLSKQLTTLIDPPSQNSFIQLFQDIGKKYYSKSIMPPTILLQTTSTQQQQQNTGVQKYSYQSALNDFQIDFDDKKKNNEHQIILQTSQDDEEQSEKDKLIPEEKKLSLNVNVLNFK